jgi:hypothetical protein
MPAPPPSHTPITVSGPSATNVVYYDSGTFVRLQGGAWTTYSDAATRLIRGTAVGWTDGRWAAAVAYDGVVLCDLGP